MPGRWDLRADPNNKAQQELELQTIEEEDDDDEEKSNKVKRYEMRK